MPLNLRRGSPITTVYSVRIVRREASTQRRKGSDATDAEALYDIEQKGQCCGAQRGLERDVVRLLDRLTDRDVAVGHAAWVKRAGRGSRGLKWSARLRGYHPDLRHRHVNRVA